MKHLGINLAKEVQNVHPTKCKTRWKKLKIWIRRTTSSICGSEAWLLRRQYSQACLQTGCSAQEKVLCRHWHFTSHRKTQGTQNSQRHLEREEHVLISKLLQRYSKQNSVVLTWVWTFKGTELKIQKQTHTLTTNWILTKVDETTQWGKKSLFSNGAGTTGSPHAEE